MGQMPVLSPLRTPMVVTLFTSLRAHAVPSTSGKRNAI